MVRYNPVPLETVSYPLSGGVETKVHGLVLPPPRLQQCTNAFIDYTGSVQRRYGSVALTNSDLNANSVGASIASLMKHQTRLVGLTATEAYDYGETLQRWTDRGRASSWPISERTIEAPDAFPGGKDIAVIGDYTLYVYDYYNTASTVTTCAFTLVDAKGTRYASQQTLTTGSTQTFSACKVVAHGAVFYIMFWDVTSASTLKCFRVDTTSAATIASSLAASATTLTANFAGALDAVDNTAFGPVIAYRHTTVNTVGFGLVNTAGLLTATTNFATVAPILSLGMAITGTTTHGIAYTVGTSPNDVYARIVSFNGALWTNVSASGAMDTAVTSAGGARCIFDSSTVLRVFYNDTITYNCIRQGTYNTAGVITSRVALLVRSVPASRPFTIGSETLQWVTNEPSLGVTQPTLFLMKRDGTVCGMAAKGIAANNTLTFVGGFPHVVTNSSGGYAFPYDEYTRIGTTDPPTSFTPGTGTKSMMREIGVYPDRVEDSHIWTEDGRCSYMGGGFLQQYDGQSFTEVNFLEFVDTTNRVNLNPTAVGGARLTPTAQYSYRIVWESVNAQGEREQGTDAGAKSITLAGVEDTITITMASLPFTNKTNVVAAIYRAVNGSITYHRVGTVANSKTTDTLTFVDSTPDTTVLAQEILYMGSSAPGDELDNLPPQGGASLVASGNGRVFVAGFPSDPNLVMYSKERQHGEALAFNDSLVILFPQGDGPITGLCVFAESLIVFTETSIYRVNGGGLSNTGTSGGYSDPVRVMTGEGALSQRGICVTPMGVMFESEKGKMLLQPSFTVQYIGASLEKSTDLGSCVSATLIPSAQQVRYAYATGTHVFDYYHGEWFVWSTAANGPCVVWNDVYTVPKAGVFYDSATSFLDYDDGVGSGVSYAMTLMLGWMKLGSLADDLQVRRFTLIGQAIDGSNLYITIAKDQEADNQIISTSASIGKLQRTFRVNKQVASHMRITITDGIPTGGSPDVQATAGLRLEAVVFEMALRSREVGRKEV